MRRSITAMCGLLGTILSASAGRAVVIARRAAVLALAVPLLVAGAAAQPVAAQPVASVVRAGVDDFRFSQYSADFRLDRDAEGHSILSTVETFVADFPPSQNRGMQRAIPLEYEGHPTDLDLVSVTDGDGSPRPIDTEREDGFLLVTSAADEFVSGSQTYVFTYTQHNTTLPGSGTRSGEDEFYWDVNGTAWRQPFDRYDVRVELAGSLASAATGTVSCSRGPDGSTTPCSIGRDGGVVTAVGESLAPGENVSVAIGFAPGTFTPRDDRYVASGWSWVQLAGLALVLVALGFAVRRRRTVLRDAPGRSAIVAEYDPPEQGLFLSAALLRRTTRAPAAGLLDAAVRGLVRIEETGDGRKPAYAVRVLDPATTPPRRAERPRPVSSDDRRFLDLAVGRVPGAVRVLSGKDREFGKEVAAFQTALGKRVTEAGLRRPGTVGGSVAVVAVLLLGVLAVFVSAIVLLTRSFGGPLPLVLLVVGLAAGIVGVVLVSRVPLTAVGAELRDHLRGLEFYLRLAEADRFAMVQSPRGANRRSVGPVEVVEVTERLLPWAVLFGLEKEWSAELASAYERTGEDPVWYSGSGGFHAAAFAGSVSSFSSSASSYVGSSSSSSSGGAGGGGSSGGGGGGGGGGGV
ncbi:hypothetical protein A6122_2440 [Rathayibacter tritici]|uniref:DUF2207 domain-containing protein n=2 Tax=Rathayibacter tritici TaxID=33888 RepID=A0A160KUI6_9MICO|nr:hypothetical protein A6122_2440 [Rathayibacter tritici]